MDNHDSIVLKLHKDPRAPAYEWHKAKEVYSAFFGAETVARFNELKFIQRAPSAYILRDLWRDFNRRWIEPFVRPLHSLPIGIERLDDGDTDPEYSRLRPYPINLNFIPTTTLNAIMVGEAARPYNDEMFREAWENFNAKKKDGYFLYGTDFKSDTIAIKAVNPLWDMLRPS